MPRGRVQHRDPAWPASRRAPAFPDPAPLPATAVHHTDPVDWSLRACARKGHITYAPDEPVLRARLAVDTSVGEAWRCLRCGDFAVGPAHSGGPAEDAPVVLRGKALRDATVLRLLAGERFVRAVVLFGLAYAVIRFRTAQGDLRASFEQALPVARPLADRFHLDLTDSGIVTRIRSVLASNPHTLTLVTVFLLGYGALQLVEAVGLYSLKRWGEYVAVVGTSVFLPVEVHELLAKVTALRVGAFAVNVAAVVYLVHGKRLFGLRGGLAAVEAAQHSASFLQVEAAADQPGGQPVPL